MCTVGRIKHHLKHNLWRPGASLIIIGFQAQGTTGRKIVEGAKTVTIFGEKIAVKAKVYTIGGFSAHTDQADLLKWVGRFTAKSRPRVFLIHGESMSSEALGRAIQSQFGLDTHVPEWREVLDLGPAQTIPKEVREPVAVPVRDDMLTLTADLEAEIARLKEQLSARDKEISEADMERLKEMRTTGSETLC